MADRPEKMNVEAVIELLNKALRCQYRSALQYALAGGGMTGLQGQSLSGDFAAWSRHELDDCGLLVEKIVALGGTPTSDVAPFSWSEDPATRFSRSPRTRLRRSPRCTRSFPRRVRNPARRRSSTLSST